MRRSGAVAFAAAAAAALLSACSGGSSGSSASATGGGTLTFANRYAPGGLNPATTSYDRLQPLAYEPILQQTPDGAPAPGLATSWGYVGTGNREFTFTLRHDAFFSDGKPVNAAAVKTWLDYFAGAGGPNAATMGKIASITTPDDWTVDIKLAQPNPIVTNLLTGPNGWGEVASPPIVTTKPDSLTTATAGAGPYMLVPGQTVTGDHYTYVPNPHYFDKSKIHWKKIVVKIITDGSSLLQAAQTGQIQGGTGTFATSAAAKKAGLQVLTPFTYQEAYLITDALGKRVKALGDPRVRQALNYGIDRAAIAKALYGPDARYSSELASKDGYSSDLADDYSYDVTKAKSLLAAAGYPKGFSIGVISEDLGGADYAQATQAVVSYWEKLGIKVNLKHETNVSDYLRDVKDSAYQIVQTPVPFIQSMYQIYKSFWAAGSLYNPNNETDSTLQDLFTTGSAAKDPSVAAKAMSKYITEQGLIVPLATQPTPTYAVKGITGVSSTDARPYDLIYQWQPKK